MREYLFPHSLHQHWLLSILDIFQVWKYQSIIYISLAFVRFSILLYIWWLFVLILPSLDCFLLGLFFYFLVNLGFYYEEWILTIICCKCPFSASLILSQRHHIQLFNFKYLAYQRMELHVTSLIAGISAGPSLGHSIALSDQPLLSGTDAIWPVAPMSPAQPTLL